MSYAVYWLEQTKKDVPETTIGSSPVKSIVSIAFDLPNAARTGASAAGLRSAQSLPASIGRHLPNTCKDRNSCHPPAPLKLSSRVSAHPGVSLSHRAGRAMCAVSPPGFRLGCDLETIESRSRIRRGLLHSGRAGPGGAGVLGERPKLVTFYGAPRKAR